MIGNKLDLDDQKSDGVFYESIYDSDLYNTIVENLPTLQKINDGIYDKYIFDADYNVGKYLNMDTNLIEITTLCNTLDIISLKPVISNVTSIYRKTKKLSLFE